MSPNMRMRTMKVADALLVGPGVDVQEVLRMFFLPGYGYDFLVYQTKSGNRVLVPVYRAYGTECMMRLPIASWKFEWRWPILPLCKHRSGYTTATARTYMEIGMWPYADTDDNDIERKGKYPRTRHRVVYADRANSCLVIDVLLRPNGVAE